MTAGNFRSKPVAHLLPLNAMIKRACFSLSAILGAVLISACASSGGSSARSSYPVTSQKSIQKVEKGKIVAVRKVQIEGYTTGTGALLGAAVGAATGSAVVPSKTETVVSQVDTDIWNISTKTNANQRNAAMILGGAAGAVVGKRIEKIVTATTADELTVALESGETVVVVQKPRQDGFEEDEEVKVCTTNLGATIVYHIDDMMHVDPDTNAYLITPGEELAGDQELEPVTW